MVMFKIESISLMSNVDVFILFSNVACKDVIFYLHKCKFNVIKINCTFENYGLYLYRHSKN